MTAEPADGSRPGHDRAPVAPTLPVSSSTGVSRGTAQSPPLSDEARELLGGSVGALGLYAEWLGGPGVERGLIGPRETPRLWERHILNCAVVAPLIPVGSTVDDVGSGAGLPGMVLALVRPDLEVTLVEPLLRRATFLTEVVDQLAIKNVRVERIRAEDAGRAVQAGSRAERDIVTARAVASLERLAAWCLPLLKAGGQLLALKGSSATAEVAAAGGALRTSGAAVVEVLAVGAGIVDPPTTVIRVTKASPPARRRPRS